MVLILSLEHMGVIRRRVISLLEDVESCVSGKDEIRVVDIDVSIFNSYQVIDHLFGWLQVLREQVTYILHDLEVKLLEPFQLREVDHVDKRSHLLVDHVGTL